MEVEILVKKFKSTFALTAILMVTVLLSGCFGVGRTKTFTLTVNVVPEGAAAVSGVADKYDEKAIAQFTLEAAEGYEFVEWTGEVKPVGKDGKWTIVMDGDKTLTAVFKEIEEEPATEEELVAAVVEASEGEDEEAFLEALQALEEAGLVNNVIEEYAALYHAQAKDFFEFGTWEFLPLNAPFMRTAEEVQKNVINPVNKAVSSLIDFVNDARSSEMLVDSLGELHSLGLLEGVNSDDAEIYVELIGKYPSATLEDLQNIIDGASVRLAVEALFANMDAKELELAEGVDQAKIDSVNKLVADVEIAGLKVELEDLIEVAQGLVDDVVFESVDKQIKELFELDGDGKFVKDDDDELILAAEDKTAIEAAQKALNAYKGSKSTAELQALIDKAEELLAKAEEENLVKRINEEDAGSLATLIINELEVKEFIGLSAAQRAEVAERLFDARSADGYEAYESSENFILAVEAEIEVYLGLIDAVNNATDKLDMVDALSAINEDYANLEGGLDAQLPLAEEMYAKVTDKDFVKYTTLADIKTAAGWLVE
jgi:hypothetical protein